MIIDEHIFLENFGKKLRTLRKEKGFSQFQLAVESGIPKTQVGRIERAEINTTLRTIFKLSKALNIESNELFISK